MVVDLKFSKFSDEPWGFRLIGGADFEFPLTVIKVTENSLSEQAGMKFGDIVVRINDTPASNLTHLEAHNVLLAAGNNFMLGVQRDNEPVEEEEEPILDETSNGYVSEGEAEVREILYNLEVQKIENPEEIIEGQIAGVLSSEAELLKEHNVMGVNFNKLIPKVSAIKSSEVLRELNAEAVKTEEDKQAEKRKWTTFLQKPNRPIPKTKEELAREKLPQYKVRIVKQPKAGERQPTPPPTQAVEEVVKCENNDLEEKKVEEEPPVEEPKAAEEELVEEKPIEPVEEPEVEIPTEDDEVPDLEPQGLPTDLEKQLADVQKQLLALSNLPQAIQATLDAVTVELAKIVPLAKRQSTDREYRSKSPSRDIVASETTDIMVIEETVEESLDRDKEETVDDQEQSDCSSQSECSQEDACSVSSFDAGATPESKLEVEPEKLREQHQEELKRAVATKRNDGDDDTRERQRSKLVPGKLGAKSVFGPLVPQQRPIYLPGGRKWRTEKDAFNDEFIKEIISSQAELIVGTTLGVNFLKYKKPEKKVDLKNSEVFRYLNNLESDPPRKGIEARPERVYTEADVRRVCV